jgi:hypothetical protein
MTKRKKKVLHVDELIVKADKVIIQTDEKEKKKDKRKRPRHGDWFVREDNIESSSSSSISDDKNKYRDPWL